MANATDVSRLFAVFTKPDQTNPYKFNGISYAPALYSRVFRTADDVVRHIAQAKIVRDLSDDDIAARTGLAPETLEKLVTRGEGTLDDFLVVTEALGVRPVCIPDYIVSGQRPA